MEILEENKIYLGKPQMWKEMKIKYPLYQNCYANALEVLWNNFRHNEDAEVQNNPPGMISNIIAFMGVRGSGKTTALCEFNKILKDYDKYKAECGSVLFHKKQTQEHEGWFYVLPSIDASLLEKDEDIIELIWANMYKDFTNANKRERKQERLEYREDLGHKILEEFDDVYNGYKKPRENKTILGDEVLAKLKHLSSSLKTKEACDGLIGDFLKYMQFRTERKRGKSFLVVTVDDLDLNLESGYRIIEDLYRYLNNPRVIVLIAVDFFQMKAMSDRHFINSLYTEMALSTSSNIEQAMNLSSDFLVKVLPLANRVYMPDIKNILNNAVVVSADRSGDLKQFVLGKIAEKMGIYYDAVGLKWHFCVPRTQRELIQYNDFLETLYDTENFADHEEIGMRLYDANHERFNRDIGENMVPRVLDLEQQEIFKLILDRNIDRRAKYAVNFLDNRRKTFAEQEKHQELLDSVDEQEYSYSDLLKDIYELGRLNYGDKALVHCVLASFTSEMTREYYSYMHNPDEEARKRAARRLKSFLGNTFGGRWFKDIGPEIEAIDSGGNPFKLRSAIRGNIKKFKYDHIMIATHDGDYIENISCLIPILECAFLLFPNCYNEDGDKVQPIWKTEIAEGVIEEGRIYYIEVKSEDKLNQADFDIFGFVGKEIETEMKEASQTEKLLESLMGNLSDIWKKEGRDVSEEDKKKWREALESKSIWKGMEERQVYFPFYNLDMAYNVVKRVRRKIWEVTRSNSVLQYLQSVNGYVAYELYKEDEYYKGIDEYIRKERSGSDFKQVASSFRDDFVSSPYVKAIGYQYWDDDRKEKISGPSSIDENIFNKLMYNALNDFVSDGREPMSSLAGM